MCNFYLEWQVFAETTLILRRREEIEELSELCQHVNKVPLTRQVLTLSSPSPVTLDTWKIGHNLELVNYTGLIWLQSSLPFWDKLLRDLGSNLEGVNEHGGFPMRSS